jgi:hypothetical protein
MLGRRTFKTGFALGLVAVVACGPDSVEDAESSESPLLPNGSVFEAQHDGGTYRVIAEYFRSRNLDLHVTLDTFAPAWPLGDAKSAVLNRLGTPVLFGSIGYYHTGLDVIRSAPSVSTDVLAPHDGLAVVFDWAGNRITQVQDAQTTVVAIYDPVSHVVTQLMHVRALDALAQSADPIAVTKGQVIGKLAPAPVPASNASRLSHTHVDFIDGENMTILDPAKLFAGYHDTIAPQVNGVYVAGDDAKVTTELRSGKLDVIVETSDHDDDSSRNLEISSLAFTIKDQGGNVLVSQGRCDLLQLFDSIAQPSSFRAKQLMDFGSAAAQVSGGWPGSDVDNPARTFRYALTQLLAVDGRCAVKDDAQGFLEISDSVTKLVVDVTLWDAKGNQVQKTVEVNRGGGSTTDPDPPPVLPWILD